MNPAKNQLVKLYFKNGFVEEGIVVSWSDNKSVLKSISSDNLLIIQNTKEDIMLIKICVEETKPQPQATKVYKDEPIELKERDPKLRAMKLVELRETQRKEEAERARILMTTFKPNATIENNYGIPIKLQKPPNFDTRKKG